MVAWQDETRKEYQEDTHYRGHEEHPWPPRQLSEQCTERHSKVGSAIAPKKAKLMFFFFEPST